jgi:hypothetical protein
MKLCAAWLLLLTVLYAPGAAAGEGVARFAVVIGNNGSDSPKVKHLRYADDDAIATQRLLEQAGAKSILLVNPDADTRRLHPALAPDGPPTREKLLAAFSESAARMKELKDEGARVEFLFIYSGHGNVAHGEGYIVLQGGKLTRSDLYDQILSKSPADRNHVIVDACKSYFLAFGKGPGGERRAYSRYLIQKADASTLSNTGFILSTSSDRDSHEWERFQAGVFSHEVRSALRGGADVDGDRRITYGELGAFLKTANTNIVNARYRPDFIMRPPGDSPGELSEAVIDWAANADFLVMDDVSWGHVYLENSKGERVMDVHPAAGEKFIIHLPANRPVYVRDDQEAREVVVDGAGESFFSMLVVKTVGVGSKGSLHLAFEDLFSEPFGKQKLLDYRGVFGAQPEPDALVSIEAEAPGRTRSIVRQTALWTTIGATAAGAALNLWALERQSAGEGASHERKAELNRQIDSLNTAAVVFYILAGSAAATWLALTLWPDESTGDGSVTIYPSVGPTSVGIGLQGRFGE